MFYATTAPTGFHSHLFSPAGRSLERFLSEAQLVSRQKSCAMEQDDKSYTLSFDVPGIAKDQLSISVEGAVVRIETKEGAPRQYRQAYELPQDIDVASSEAKLEHGVLTVKLAKVVPVSRVTELPIQ
jgi:HSP20 family molecular chaperone IbpA